MKLLMVSDYYMYSHKGKFYFENKEKYDFFHRYLRVFNKLRLVTRCIEELEIKSSRVPLDDDLIEYIPVPVFHGPFQYLKNYLKIGFATRSITKGCQVVILQLPSTTSQRVSNQIINSGIPYGVEVVYDAQDGWESETSLIKKLLWKRIDSQMRFICNNADGVACVTEHYLQKHYYSSLMSR